VGAKVREINWYKLWYSGSNRVRNGVGISDDKELADLVVRARCKSDRITVIKVVVGSKILNVVSVHAPQVGLAEDIKNQF